MIFVNFFIKCLEMTIDYFGCEPPIVSAIYFEYSVNKQRANIKVDSPVSSKGHQISIQEDSLPLLIPLKISYLMDV